MRLIIERWRSWIVAGVLMAGGILGARSGPAFAATIPSLTALEQAHPAMSQVLQRGSEGHWVATLQADLQELGYAEVGPVDGIFGPKTEKALQAFESAHGFTADGVTSPPVWQDILAGFGLVPTYQGTQNAATIPSLTALEQAHPAMSQVLQRGSEGHWVATLQADLQELGYAEVGPVDGIFGPKTEKALQAFESAHGFTADGVTSPPVWQDILAGLHLVPAYQGSSSESTNPVSGSTGSTNITASTNYAAGSIDGHPILRVIHMIATAYGPSWQDNYPYGPVDVFGQPLEAGMVAVDPSVIPLKSYVYVTGYSDSHLPQGGFLGRAMDTGGAIQGNRIDIFMNANATTVSNFGIEPVTVYVLGK